MERGHEVTCLTRGVHDVPSGAEHIAADRDRDDALAPVAGRTWDVVLDVSRTPGHVRRAVRDLEPVAEHFLFISTVSVYADNDASGADESAELLPALVEDASDDPADYGPSKVACEQSILEGFGRDRSTILRAGLIGGPGDPTGRTDYWPWRLSHPSNPEREALIPDEPTLPTSVIDVRDLTEWAIACAERSVSGIFNTAGPSIPFADHLGVARAAAEEFTVRAAEPVAADQGWLLDQGVTPWAGPRSLPLWLPDPALRGMNARSVTAAGGAGLVCRPLFDTLRDALAVRITGPDGGAPSGAGLTDSEERDLLGAWHASR